MFQTMPMLCESCGHRWGQGDILTGRCPKCQSGQIHGCPKEQPLEAWRKVWREGLSKVISLDGLKALLVALVADDKRLIQGATTSPPPLMCVADWPVEAADAIGICGWLGEGIETVGGVEEYFAKRCFDSDQLMKEPAAVRFFLNWADETPRNQMREALLPEVELAIRERHKKDSAAATQKDK